MLDLLDKGFKINYLNMSKALKETISKELKDRTVSHQIQTINKEIQITEKRNQIEILKLKSTITNKNFITGAQQQM